MIGFLFATKKEATPLIQLIDDREETETALSDKGGMLVASNIAVWVSGMGKIEAKNGTEKLIENYAPTRVFNLGIAGALSPQLAIGGIYRITSAVSWPDGATMTVPESEPSFQDVAEGRLVTSDEPVFGDEFRARLASLGEIVDMEGTAVLSVCHALGVPCTMLKAISDKAKTGDRERLRSNLTPLSTHLAKLVTNRLNLARTTIK